MTNLRTPFRINGLIRIGLCLLLTGCASIEKPPNSPAIENGRILLVHSAEKKRAVKARFEWLESYESEGKTVVMRVFDLWGNRLFETSKEFRLANGTNSDWSFTSSNGNAIKDSLVTKEIHNLLKIQITRESLFSLFDDISHLIHKARKTKQDKPVHNLKRRLPSSEISIKVVFD